MISQGQVALPRFQRHEAWSAGQIEGVLENVLRQPSLPIGALLTLEVGDKELFHSRSIVGAPPTSQRPSMHLLDGQQRMTALWRSLHADYDDMTIFVKLNGEDSEPDVEIVKRWPRKGIRYPVWADDPVQQFERSLVPIDVLCPGNAGEERLDAWCDAVGASNQDGRRIAKLRSRVAAYKVPFLELPVGTSQETALNVFINMNTSASPLKDFDIVVAQLEGAVGNSLHEMVEDLKQRVPATAHFSKIEDLTLSVGALLLGKPPLKATYLDLEFGKAFAEIWTDVLTGIERGLNFLQDEGIYSDKLLPTEVAVYLVSALWARAPKTGGDEEGRARTLIRKALWRASFTDRYLKTAATRGYADFVRLAEIIRDRDHPNQPELFDEEANPLPSVEELAKAGWPSRKDRLARAIIACSMHKGGYDFADGEKAKATNIDRREYHHLVPVSVLGVDRDDAYATRAMNCALISWKTNRKIGANTPMAYLQERAKEAGLGEAEVRQRLESHMVPYDTLKAGEYEAFIQVRAGRVHAAMVKLCTGEIV